MDWIINNKDWLFSGIGVVVFGFLYKRFTQSEPQASPIVEASNTNTMNVVLHSSSGSELVSQKVKKYKTAQEAQKNINILFIDDDTNFKVVNLLKTAGYKNTKILKDIRSLDSNEIITTDIFFIDIQGVGKKLAFKDEGLGLANALKEKYKDKIIVIYSAENRGDRFHSGLRKADDFLPKNADPYEFQQIIETFFVEE